MSYLSVRVVPNASKNEVVGYENGAWKIRLAAPPVDGKANIALCRFIADVLDLAQREIDVLRGHSSKTKILTIPLSDKDIEDGLRAHIARS